MLGERVPTWGLAVILAGSLLVTWLCGRLILRRYQSRWPW